MMMIDRKKSSRTVNQQPGVKSGIKISVRLRSHDVSDCSYSSNCNHSIHHPEGRHREVMSAIKTVRYEAPAIYEEGDYDESSEYESEEYEEEEEVVEVEVEEVQAQQAGQEGEDMDVEYEVPYLDQQRQEPGDEPREKKIPASRVLPVADLPDDFEGEALDGATYLALAKWVLSPHFLYIISLPEDALRIVLIYTLVDRTPCFPML